MKHYIFTTLFLIVLSQVVEAQNKDPETLIEELKLELFSENSLQISMAEYLKDSNYGIEIDTSWQIRKAQPSKNISIGLIEQIMHERSAHLYDELLTVYKKQMKLFLEDWSRLYEQKYKLPDKVVDQFSILSAFEIALRSLQVQKENKSAAEIFNQYYSEFLLAEKIFQNSAHRCELIKDFPIVLQSYRDLNGCRLFYGSLKFNYIDPFLKELKPFFISKMLECGFSTCHWNSLTSSCKFYTNNERRYYEFESEEIVDFLINNYSDLRNCKRHTIAFRYASHQQSIKLMSFLAGNLVSELSEFQYPFTRDLLNGENNFNLEVIIDYILNYPTDDFEDFEILLNELPSERTIEILKRKDSNNRKAKKILKYFQSK